MPPRRKSIPVETTPDAARPSDLSTYPVRSYVAAMSAELATMAREDGDRLLSQVLDVAAQLARRPA